MFQLTRFSHNTVFFRNQNARYAGTRCIQILLEGSFTTKANIEDGVDVILIFVIQNMCHLYMNCHTQNARKLVARGRHTFKYFQISNQQSTSGVWDCGCPNGDLPWRHLHYQSRHRRWYTCLSSPWHQSVIMVSGPGPFFYSSNYTLRFRNCK